MKPLLLLLLVSSLALADEVERNDAQDSVSDIVSIPQPSAQAVTAQPDMKAVLAEWGIDTADVKQEDVNDSEDSDTASVQDNGFKEGSRLDIIDDLNVSKRKEEGKEERKEGENTDAAEESLENFETRAYSASKNSYNNNCGETSKNQTDDSPYAYETSKNETDDIPYAFESCKNETDDIPIAFVAVKIVKVDHFIHNIKIQQSSIHKDINPIKDTTTTKPIASGWSQQPNLGWKKINRTITHSTPQQHSSTLGVNVRTRYWDRYTPQGPSHTTHSSLKPTNQEHPTNTRTNYEHPTTKHFNANTDDRTVKLTTATPSVTKPTTTKPTNQEHPTNTRTNYEHLTTKHFNANTDDRTVKLTTATPSATMSTTEKPPPDAPHAPAADNKKTNDAVKKTGDIKEPSKTDNHKEPLAPPKIDDADEAPFTKREERPLETSPEENDSEDEAPSVKKVKTLKETDDDSKDDEIERPVEGTDQRREKAGKDDDEDDEDEPRRRTRLPSEMTTTKRNIIKKIWDKGLNAFTGGCREARKEVQRKGGYEYVDAAVQAKYTKCIEEEGPGFLGTIKGKVADAVGDVVQHGIDTEDINDRITGTTTRRVPRDDDDYDSDPPSKGGRPKADTGPEERDEKPPREDRDYPEDKDESEAGDRKDQSDDDYNTPKDAETDDDSSKDKDEKGAEDGKEPSDDYDEQTPKEDEDKAPKSSEVTDEKEDDDRKSQSDNDDEPPKHNKAETDYPEDKDEKEDGDNTRKEEAKSSEDDNDEKKTLESKNENNNADEKKSEDSVADESTVREAGIEPDAPKDEEVDSKDASEDAEAKPDEKPEAESEGSGTDELDDALAQLNE